MPALLGPNGLPAYGGYRPRADARIANEFSAAAFRFGHSALSPMLLRIDERGREIAEGHLPLRSAFFAPRRTIEEGGIEPILRGLAAQRMQRIDAFVVDDVRNFLFGAPGQGGFDLPALNIQHGRDHGLPTYNATRAALGLRSARSFADMTTNRALQRRLASVYVSPGDVDLWVGGLAEDPVPGSHVGELVRTMLIRQVTALRDGDRFWHQRVLSASELRMVESSRLSDIIRRNTSIGRSLQTDAFRVPTR